MTPNKDQLKDLMSWQSRDGIDFWSTGGAGATSRVMVSPDLDVPFLNFLTQNEVRHDLTIKDVEPSLQKARMERIESRKSIRALSDENDPNFEVYWSYEEMKSFTIRLAQQYPNLVKRDVIGQSIEGRDIFGLRISSGSDFGRKPIIFIDAGVHAREWVGHQSALYLINQLVTNATVTAELVSKVDWVIVPIANPDGEFATWLDAEPLRYLQVWFLFRLCLFVHRRQIVEKESKGCKLYLHRNRLKQEFQILLGIFAEQCKFLIL